jgi:hypothetical protein
MLAREDDAIPRKSSAYNENSKASPRTQLQRTSPSEVVLHQTNQTVGYASNGLREVKEKCGCIQRAPIMRPKTRICQGLITAFGGKFGDFSFTNGIWQLFQLERIGALLRVHRANFRQVFFGWERAPPSSRISLTHVSIRACSPRNLMKMIPSRMQNTTGSEQRDRVRSGEIEAVHVSDPERACLSEVIGRRFFCPAEATIVSDPQISMKSG